MLIQRLRHRIRGFGAYLIVTLLALPLALVGFNWFGASCSNVVVAKINGESLHLSEVDRYAYQERRRILESQGDDVDPDAISNAALRRSALSLLLSRTALLQRAKTYGFELSNERVNHHLRAQPQFQEAGRFSRQRYEWLLQQGGFTPSWYREVQHDSLLISQLTSVCTDSEFMTEYELIDMLEVAAERRVVRYMVLPTEAAHEQITLSDDALRAAFDNNLENYRQPALLTVDYVELTRKAFYPQIGEKQLRQYYDQEVVMLNARVHAAHILIDGDVDADDSDGAELRERVAQLQARLAAGEDFAELAAEYSDDLLSADDGGSLGNITPGDLPAPLEEALSFLAPGEVAATPIRSEAGLHFLRRLKVPVADYAERSEQIRERLQQLNSEANYRQAQERLGDLSFNAPDLASVAEAMAIEVSRSAWFDRDGAQDEKAGIAVYAKVRAAAFSAEVLEQGENSQLLEIGSDGDERTLVLRLGEYQESRRLTFDEAQPTLRTDVLRRRTAQWLKKQAHSVAQQLRDDRELTVDAQAHADGYEWFARPHLLRHGDDETPNAVVRKAFQLPAPSTDSRSVGTAELSDGTWAVLSVLAIKALELELLSPQQRVEWRQSMREQFGDSHELSYRRYVLVSAQVE